MNENKMINYIFNVDSEIINYHVDKISNYSEPADWRNYIIKQFIRSNPEYSKDILYFPFADATKETPDMHTCHLKYKHDCTHYCFWPLLYQPLWNQINKASENLLHKFLSMSIT